MLIGVLRAASSRLTRLGVLLALAASLGGLGACGGDLGDGGVTADGSSSEQTARRGALADGQGREGPTTPATVVRVIDGDTVDARLPDGSRRRVRLLGIDTPEKTELRAGRAECGGQEATRFTESLARRWPKVLLRTDPTQDAEDRYGRLLAYLDVDGEAGRSYQDELLTQGWAKVYSLDRSPIVRVRAFRAAAATARTAGRGVWARCGGDFRRPLPG